MAISYFPAAGGGGGSWGSITGTLSNQTDLQNALNAKQATLVSGTNIKTINSTSLLGSGDIAISGSVADGDKGDITVSGSGATWTIDNNVVTFEKNEVRLRNMVSSGVVSGGALSINVDNTKFDISDGSGIIVDNTTIGTPTVTDVTWSGLTAQTVTNIATQTVTHVFIDNGGAVVQTNTEPTPAQRRQYIYLGQLGHTNNTNISAVVNVPDFYQAPISQHRDLVNAIGIINKSGNQISANGANLNINKSAGVLFYSGVNFHTNAEIPNQVSIASATAATFRLRTQTGNGSTTTTLDVGNYDNAGTITAVSGTKAQNFRVFLVSNGNIVIQYGQVTYNSIAAAISGLQSESFVQFANLERNAVLIGIITALSNATALNSETQAKFLNVSKFGELIGAGSGSSVSTLQNVYDNSSTPEILTDATRGAVSIRRGSGADTDNVLEGLNNASTVTFGVTGNGVINSGALTASELVATDGSKNLQSLAVATYPSLTELSYVKGVTSAIQTQINGKQETLVSGTNIKTVNSQSLLGSGNLTITASAPTWGTATASTASANSISLSTNYYVEVAGDADFNLTAVDPTTIQSGIRHLLVFIPATSTRTITNGLTSMDNFGGSIQGTTSERLVFEIFKDNTGNVNIAASVLS